MPDVHVTDAAVIAALVTTVGSMAGFIVFLIKRSLDDKDKIIAAQDKQIARWAEVFEKNGDNSRDNLILSQEQKEVLKEIRDAVLKVEQRGNPRRGT